MTQRCRGTNLKGIRCKKRTKNLFCNYHTVEYNIELPDKCVICFESITRHDSSLECGHIFHKSCLLHTINNKCPLCRFQSNKISNIKYILKTNEKKLLNKIIYSKAINSYIIDKNKWIKNNDSEFLAQKILSNNIEIIKKEINKFLLDNMKKNLYNMNSTIKSLYGNDKNYLTKLEYNIINVLDNKLKIMSFSLIFNRKI